MKTQIYYKRLIWIVFILLYSGLFFYNCLSPYENWFFPYLYTLILILWLCKEYYQKNLFFQPNFVPAESHNYLLRGLFALFFYSSLVFGITTIVWWHQYRILNSPILSIIGILLLGYGVYQREQSLRTAQSHKQSISRFYFTTALVTLSMFLGYDSFFLLVYALVVGLPLIFLQAQYYKKQQEVKAN
ncbi:MAG: hypothetical protein ABIL22_03010 [candidate division WOR-3 bacterium]